MERDNIPNNLIPDNQTQISIESEIYLGTKVEFQDSQEIFSDEITRFTPETRMVLEEAGFMIFDLNDDSMGNQSQLDHLPYRSTKYPSINSQVAVDMNLVRRITNRYNGSWSSKHGGVSEHLIEPIKFEGPANRQRKKDALAITYLHDLGFDSVDLDIFYGDSTVWTKILQQHKERTGELLLTIPHPRIKGELLSGPWIGARPGRKDSHYPSSSYYDLLRWEPGPERKSRDRIIQHVTGRNKSGELIPLVVPAELLTKLGLPPTERLRIPEEHAPIEVGDVRYATLPDGTKRRVLVDGISSIIDKTHAHCYLILENRLLKTELDIIPTESISRSVDEVIVEMAIYGSLDTSILSSERTSKLSPDEIKNLKIKYDFADGSKLTPAQIVNQEEELKVMYRLSASAFEYIISLENTN